jgi:serine/threonine-protein kinase
MRVLDGARQRAGDTARIARAASPERELIAGRYEIVSLIGRGGMAEVYAGRDRMLERQVAIKRPLRELAGDAESSDRLQREAIALATIDSPHVVGIHDVGFTPEGVYLVMQRLYGRTLDAEITKNGAVSPARACRIARDILVGLAAVHAAGLIHRDLKASNVLLDRGDRAVLLDLGAALHPRRRPLTAPGTVLGTPECMAPEQLTAAPLDGRVDLFQLGLILIHLLTGAMAERASARPGSAGARSTPGGSAESSIDPAQLRDMEMPGALREVIAQALAPAESRFANAIEMRRALDLALAACALEQIQPAIPRRRTLRWPESP